MTSRLPHDYCRCHDSMCADRAECARYVLRRVGGDRTPHSDTLWNKGEDECGSFILYEPEPK